MEEIRILLVGFGNIGSRYVQGMLDIDWININLDIVEPIKNNYFSNIEKINFDKKKLHKCKRIKIEEIDSNYDVIIVTTSAAPRASIILKLTANTQANYWLLEKNLCQSIEQLNQIQSALVDQMVWVNLPRRLSPLYIQIKELIKDTQIVEGVFSNSTLDLACNAIHYIDIFSWLTSTKLKETTVRANSGWFSGKRDGYFEFKGEVRCIFENGSTLILDNSKSKSHDGLDFSIDNKRYELDERVGLFFQGKPFISGKNLMQSEIMDDILCSILDKNQTCKLATLKETLHDHRIFYNAILKNDILKSSDGIIKIT